MEEFYKGYVFKNEFAEYFGKDKHVEVLKQIFSKMDHDEDWRLEDFLGFLRSDGKYPSNTVWYLDREVKDTGRTTTNLTGWNEYSVANLGYFKVSPQQFVTALLGDSSHKPKPRYRKKRQPVPKRKKTDITVYYGTGEKYTIKDVAGLVVEDGVTSVVSNFVKKDGFFEDKAYHFSTENVDSFLVKSPEETYTLDHVGNNEFLFIKDNLKITLKTVQQIFYGV